MSTGATLTIVALGDSTTAGTPGFRSPVEAPPDGDGDVTSQFTWWLMRAEPAWRVLNRGVDGERTDEIAARFDRDVLSHLRRHAPTAGADPAHSAGPSERAASSSCSRASTTCTRVETSTTVQAGLLAMFDRARGPAFPVVACSIIPFDTATAEQNARMHAINAWIRDTASATRGMAFCDTRAAVARPDDPDRLIDTPDGLHPTPAGYRRMADALLPVLRALASAR